MSSYSHCKILIFKTPIAQKVFNTRGCHPLGQLIRVPTPFQFSELNFFFILITTRIAYANEANIVKKAFSILGNQKYAKNWRGELRRPPSFASTVSSVFSTLSRPYERLFGCRGVGI